MHAFDEQSLWNIAPQNDPLFTKLKEDTIKADNKTAFTAFAKGEIKLAVEMRSAESGPRFCFLNANFGRLKDLKSLVFYCCYWRVAKIFTDYKLGRLFYTFLGTCG